MWLCMGYRLLGQILEEGGGGGGGIRRKQSNEELLSLQTIGSVFMWKKRFLHSNDEKTITRVPAGTTVYEIQFIKHCQVITRSPPSGL